MSRSRWLAVVPTLHVNSRRSGARFSCAFLVPIIVLALGLPSASAQTWTSIRGRPALFQVVAIDRTGEPGWPYGREDVADDGLDRLDADEAQTDLRSVYADVDAQRLWLRAYFVSGVAPTAAVTAVFFLDTDGRAATGGPPHGPLFEPLLGLDRSEGGYERALAVTGDGRLRAALLWDPLNSVWALVEPAPTVVRTESGRAIDPLGLGLPEHGYVQVDLTHEAAGIDASCAARILVRVRHEAERRVFTDRTAEDFPCRRPADVYGDPDVVREFGCRVDAECPAGGRCREGVCLFAYECSRGEDCRTNERCVANRCVLNVDRACTTSSECDGLVCDSGRCTACIEGGAQSCSPGTYCSPNGSCVDPDDFEPSDGRGRVQGGAFHCAARGSSRSSLWWLLAAPFVVSLLVRRVFRRSRRVARWS